MKQNIFFLLTVILLHATCAAKSVNIMSISTQGKEFEPRTTFDFKNDRTIFQGVNNEVLQSANDGHGGYITQFNLAAAATLTRVVMNDPNQNDTFKIDLNRTDTFLNGNNDPQTLAQSDLGFHRATHPYIKGMSTQETFTSLCSVLIDGLFIMTQKDIKDELAQQNVSDFLDVMNFVNAGFGVDKNAPLNARNPSQTNNSRNVLNESQKMMTDILTDFEQMVQNRTFPSTLNLQNMDLATATQAIQGLTQQYENIFTLKLPEVPRNLKENLALFTAGSIQDLVDSTKVMSPDDTLYKYNVSRTPAQSATQPRLSIQTQLMQNYLATMTGPKATAERLLMMAKYATVLDNAPEMSLFLKEEIGQNIPIALHETVEETLKTSGFNLESKDHNTHIAEFSIALRSALSSSADGINPVREAVGSMPLSDLNDFSKAITEIYRRAFDPSLTVSTQGSRQTTGGAAM